MALSVNKIVLFGATGQTGLAVAETAVKHGYQVTMFVREPARVPSELKKNVTIVTGDVLNYEELKRAVRGQDGVVVTLGTRHVLAPTTVMSEGTQNIVNAMKELGVKRISVCISAFLFYEQSKIPPIYNDVTADHRRQAEILKSCGLDWVAICPPHINADDPRGSYKVAVGQSPGRHISKFDLADLLLKCLQSDEYLHEMIGLGYEQN